MTSLEQLQSQLKSIHDQRAQLFELIKPLQEKSASLYKDITNLNEAITIETLKTEQSEQDRFDFLMAESGAGSDMTRYNAASQLIREMDLYMTGYCQFSQQRSVEVFIYKLDEDANQKTILSIKKLIDLLKPMDEEGNKYFKVFCKDPLIFAHMDGTFSLRSRYSRNDFSTLDDLFAYYVAHHSCHEDEDNNDSDD